MTKLYSDSDKQTIQNSKYLKSKNLNENLKDIESNINKTKDIKLIYENNLIYQLIFDPNKNYLIQECLDDNLTFLDFSDENQKIYKFILSHYPENINFIDIESIANIKDIEINTVKLITDSINNRNFKNLIENIKDLSNRISSTLSVVNKTNSIMDTSIKLNSINFETIDSNYKQTNITDISQDLSDLSLIYEGISNKIKTYHFEFDKFLSGGFSEGSLNLLSGRTGAGKTELALCLFRLASTASYKPCFISLEMTKKEVNKRIIKQVINNNIDHNNVDHHIKIEEYLETKKINNTEEQYFNFIGEKSLKLQKEIQNSLSNYCKHASGCVIDEFATKPEFIYQTIKEQAKQGCKMVFLDYLGLVELAGKNQVDELGEVCRRLKILAKDYKIAIIILHQPNNSAAKKDSLTMEDLRDSGKIKDHCDLIMFVNRPDYNERKENQKATSLAFVNIDKNRNGQIGSVKIGWNNNLGIFFRVSQK